LSTFAKRTGFFVNTSANDAYGLTTTSDSRLAVEAKSLGRKMLAEVPTIVTPETRWRGTVS